MWLADNLPGSLKARASVAGLSKYLVLCIDWAESDPSMTVEADPQLSAAVFFCGTPCLQPSRAPKRFA
jgi:hypothetical protein